MPNPVLSAITLSSPTITLIAPQMGENIGAAARAMLNSGVERLRLVRPRDGWPSERAEAMSAGALAKMPPVQVYDTTEAAIADCHFVLATTARPRDQVKPVYTPRAAAEELRAREARGEHTAILFGGERAGLDNDDIALAHGIVTIPLNPDFSSLNLAQAVLLLTYEWRQAADDTPPVDLPLGGTAPVTHDKLNELFLRLEAELDAGHFFRNEDQRPTMLRNLRNLLSRAQMTEQEARTFHGMITALTGRKSKNKDDDNRFGTPLDLPALVAFIFETEKLKQVLRKTGLADGSRRENSAEHSWTLILMAMLLEKYVDTPIDLLRTIKILAVHDLAEIGAGDIFVYDESARATAVHNERDFAEKFFAALPPPLNGEFQGLWTEFETGATPEAKFARALDRLAPMLINIANGGGTWREFNITHDMVTKKARPAIEPIAPRLWTYIEAELDRAFKEGFFAG